MVIADRRVRRACPRSRSRALPYPQGPRAQHRFLVGRLLGLHGRPGRAPRRRASRRRLRRPRHERPQAVGDVGGPAAQGPPAAHRRDARPHHRRRCAAWRAAGPRAKRKSGSRSCGSRSAPSTAASTQAAGHVRAQTGLRERFAEGLVIAGRYLPGIERVFEAERVPTILSRLPFVESMFVSRAQSKVGAMGAWQFMPGTARIYLQMNPAVDSRIDTILAAEGAARMLRHDYEVLRTWPLALTAYNHGRAGVARAVKEVGTPRPRARSSRSTARSVSDSRRATSTPSSWPPPPSTRAAPSSSPGSCPIPRSRSISSSSRTTCRCSIWRESDRHRRRGAARPQSGARRRRVQRLAPAAQGLPAPRPGRGARPVRDRVRLAARRAAARHADAGRLPRPEGRHAWAGSRGASAPRWARSSAPTGCRGRIRSASAST